MKKIIIDTDICSDCDDVGALTIANHLMNAGEMELVAVTQCTDAEYGIYCAGAVNASYGNADIPLGKMQKRCLVHDVCEPWKCTAYNETAAKAYYRDKPFPEYFPAVDLLRKTLAESDEKITIVTIGALTNVSDLLDSEPDAYSPLDGVELVRRKVDRIVMMAGCFDGRDDDRYIEWNVRMDIEALRNTVAKSPVELAFCGFEMGDTVISGSVLMALPEDHPSRIGYEKFGYAEGRCSWDLATVVYAVRGAGELWGEKTGVSVTVTPEGCTHHIIDGGNCVLMTKKAPDDEVGLALDALLMGKTAI